MEIYRGKGKFIRYRSLENVFREMEQLIDRYDVPSFYLSDEIFTLDKKRVLDFCDEYKARINKPFMVQTRVDRVDAQLAAALSDAGCFMVNMSVESGNEDIRNRVLKKGFSNEQIIAAFEQFKSRQVQVSSFNMIGAPGEDIGTIHETININRKIRPDRILCTIFMPLAGTELWDYCKDNNYIGDTVAETTNYYSQVIMKHPNLSCRTLIGYQGFFDWYVHLPGFLHHFVHALRLIYQLGVSPTIPKNTIKRKLV